MDANFVGEVPDYLKCVVCHFVFRDPVLIIECGHRLCKKCFEDIRHHSTQQNAPLLCPIDRKEVEPDKVIADKGIHRVVMDLKVRCDQSDQGCTWSGDLRRLEEHKEKECGAPSLKKFMQEVEERMREKDEQLKTIEEKIYINDASVNERIQQQRDMITALEGKLCQKDEELSLLRYQVAVLRCESVNSSADVIRGEMNSAVLGEDDTGTSGKKQTNAYSGNPDNDESELSELEVRRELRRVKDLLKQKDSKISHLEFRLARVTNELFQSREQLQCSQYATNDQAVVEATTAEDHIGNSGIDKENSQGSKHCSKKNNNNSSSSAKIGDSPDGGKKTKTLVNYFANDRKIDGQNDNKSYFSSQAGTVLGKKRKADTAQAGSSKDNPGSVKHPADCVRFREIELLMKHVMNVDEYVPGDRTVFTWKITNFSHHEMAREQVDSPVFYTSIPGHCCNLFITWEDDGDLGVYFGWHLGIYREEIRDVFHKDVTFKSTGKNGKIRQLTCTKEEMRQCFLETEFKPGDKKSAEGYGWNSMFSPALIKNHVIDDTLTITCVVSHR